MIVTKVLAGTVSEGKLKIGDKILRVNDTVVKDPHHFFALLRFAPPCVRLAIFRDEKKAKELASRDHIPADRERMSERRILLVKMTWKAGGPKLGLGIKHFQNRVLVSKTDPASISAECLKIGDHVIDVNGQPVTDKGVARRMIVKAILSTGETSLLIARATSDGAKYEMEYLLKQKMHDYSDDDVPAITQKAIATVTYCGKAKHSIISTKKQSPDAVSFESDPDISSSTVTACSNASMINARNEHHSAWKAEKKEDDPKIPDGTVLTVDTQRPKPFSQVL